MAYGTDVDLATRVVNEVGEAMARDLAWANDLLETPRVERVEAIGEYGVTLKVLGRVRAPALPAVAGELRRRLLGAFAVNGIELPRPRRVVLARTSRRTRSRPGGPPARPGGLSPGSERSSERRDPSGRACRSDA